MRANVFRLNCEKRDSAVFEQIVTHFNEQIEIASVNTEDLTPYIAEAATLLTQRLTSGSLFIGCDDATFSSGYELNKRLLQLNQPDIPTLPCNFLNLNTLGLQSNSEQWLASQLAHLASDQDILLLFSSSEPSAAIANCLKEAQAQQLPTLLITPANNALLQQLGNQDSAIPLPILSTSSELQLHYSLSLLLSSLIHQSLFGQSFS